MAVKGHVHVENHFCRMSSRWWSTGSPQGPNAITARRAVRILFSNTCQKMRGEKLVKVKKQRRLDINLHFLADARKLVLGSISRDPLDHLSVNLGVTGACKTGHSATVPLMPSRK